jgi:hypothetical protein
MCFYTYISAVNIAGVNKVQDARAHVCVRVVQRLSVTHLEMIVCNIDVIRTLRKTPVKPEISVFSL